MASNSSLVRPDITSRGLPSPLTGPGATEAAVALLSLRRWRVSRICLTCCLSETSKEPCVGLPNGRN